LRTKGIFRKTDPFRLQLIYTVEDPDKRYLIYFPSFNWTRSDGFMAGVALQNGIRFLKPVNYFVMPFYTFQNKKLTGYGKISFNAIPYDYLIRLMSLTIEGEQFGAPGNQDYHKIKTGIELNSRSNRITNPIYQKAFGSYIAASDLSQILSLNHAKTRSYLQFGYLVERTGIVDPFNILASFETGKSFQKTSLEFNYRHSFYGKNNGLDIRIFAGTMLKNDSPDAFYAFSANGRSGREQYLYQGVYPDRFNKFPTTIMSREMTLSEGGLISPISDSIGYSRWVYSLSLSGNLPGKASRIPVKPFVNLLISDYVSGTTYKSPLFFEAGLKAGIWDFFEVYFPLIVSENISGLTGTLKERIRFVLKLDKLNPSRLKS
jgi:hypothetical protein